MKSFWKWYIYFFKINWSNIYKVWITKNLQNRIQTHLKYCIWLKLLISRKIFQYEKLEKMIIKKYSYIQFKKNEWFLIKDKKVVKNIISDIENFKDQEIKIKKQKDFFKNEKLFKEKINKLKLENDILDEEILKNISKNDLNFLYQEWYIKKINRYIYYNLTNNKTEKEIFKDNLNLIFSKIWTLWFWWIYSMWYKYSLYYYLNTLEKLNFEDIVFLSTRKKSKITINWEIKCSYKENLTWKFQVWKENIHILNHDELFLYLFWKQIFWQWKYTNLELIQFLKFAKLNIVNLKKKLYWNSYLRHILINSFEIYSKENIKNNDLLKLYKDFNLIK